MTNPNVKTAAEWNRLNEEARMVSVLEEVATVLPEKDIYRRWRGSLFLTTNGKVANVTEKQFQQRRFSAGVDVTSEYSLEDRMQAVKELFPLESVKLFEEN